MTLTGYARALAAILATLALPAARAAATPILDQVRFGDTASEGGHACAGPNAPEQAGALGEPCRRIGPGGSLTFTLRCDPRRQSYLTVKFWGSDQEVATLFLFNGERRLGDYLSSRPELDLCKGEAAFPGRFYYTTLPIPAEMTAGKSSVTLKIAAVGSINPYADPGRREHAQQGLTRGVYRAYTHTDPFFVPGAEEAQGREPAVRERPLPEGSPAGQLRKEVDGAVGALMRWQIFGPEWRAAIERGDVPAVLYGAVMRPMRLAKQPADAWKDAVARRASEGNATALNTPAILAAAYQDPGSATHGREELLERIACALDFCRVAQGANGGFVSDTWAGGPRRKISGGCLDGFGTAGLGQAFLLAGRALEAKGLLSQRVDDDGDPATPPVLRRDAYADLFAGHRDYLASARGRGHATNQDLAEITSMWLANEALRTLAPSRAWPRAKALEYVYAAVGLRPDPLGGHWVTRKGLALEPWGTLGGGYCGNYGLMGTHEICRLAELTGDRRVQDRARAAVRAAAYFLSPSQDADGYRCWRREEVISTRNNNWPGRVDYGGDGYAAAVLADPVAIRCAQLALACGSGQGVLEEANAHFIASAEAAALGLEAYAKATALPPSDARLPMEEGQPDFAWADEQGETVVVKDRDTRLYVSLNWRRGFRDGKRDPQHTLANNIARAHFTTPTIDRLATFAMESPYGFGKLYVCRYGPYTIVMNASHRESFPLPALPGAAPAFDLVSRRNAPTVGTRVAPGTTLVLRREGAAP